MRATKEQSQARVTELEKLAGVIPSQPTPTAVLPPQASLPPPLSGWLKATLDGKGVFGRYTRPVPQVVDIEFTPASDCKHLRLEGTVSNLQLKLPSGGERQHMMTIRNLTASSVRLLTADSRNPLDVPMGACWQVLVDADGPVHVT
jgi:hypothetical protein